MYDLIYAPSALFVNLAGFAADLFRQPRLPMPSGLPEK